MESSQTDEVDQGETTSQTAYDQCKTPVLEIAGRINGTLRVKFDSWVTELGDVLDGLGWGSWEDFAGNEYEDMELDAHAQILAAEINDEINSRKKPPSELLMRRMQGMQVAKVVRAIARERLGIPTPSKSPARSQLTGQSRFSGKTESELNRDTVKLTVYSHLKCEEKLELINGVDKPAHVSDTAAFVGEVTNVFAAMEGYEPLRQQIGLRKSQPEMTLQQFTTNADIPLDLWKQHSRLLYGGMPLMYRKEVLAKSQYASQLFEPGVMAFALFHVSVDVSDLEASRKRFEYQQPGAIRPNDKAMMESSYRQYERDSFELFHLQELATARTPAPDKQCEVGTMLFSNYPDLAYKWSRKWESSETKDMTAVREMMQEMSELIKKLPETRPQRQQAHSLGLPRPRQPHTTGGTLDKYMCKDFQRTGKCDWEARTGKKCRFSHSPAKVMMAQLNNAEVDVKVLQGTFNHMDLHSKEADGQAMNKQQFKEVYDVAYQDVGTPQFSTTNRQLLMMCQDDDLEDICSDDDADDIDAAQRAIDEWHL